jgi:hypothetical protein
MYTFSNCTKQLKSRNSSYDLTSLMWGHSSLYPREAEGESSDEASSRRVRGGGATRRVGGGGGATRCVGGGGATTHISTESSDEASLDVREEERCDGG